MSDICHECGHDFDAARAELEKVKQERQELADAGIIVSRALTQAATDLSEALEHIYKLIDGGDGLARVDAEKWAAEPEAGAREADFRAARIWTEGQKITPMSYTWSEIVGFLADYGREHREREERLRHLSVLLEQAHDDLCGAAGSMANDAKDKYDAAWYRLSDAVAAIRKEVEG